MLSVSYVILKDGEPWTYELLNELADQVTVNKKGKVVPIQGVKSKAWWQFISLNNYLVPLLHTLIGIGNDIYDNFKDIVNEEIECLDPKEVVTRRKVVVCQDAIKEGVSKRKAFDDSPDGKSLMKLKSLVYRRKEALKELGNTDVAAVSTGMVGNASIDLLLAEIDEYVNDEEIVPTEEEDTDDININNEDASGEEAVVELRGGNDILLIRIPIHS